MTIVPLRFVLLVDQEMVPAWAARCVRAAVDSGAAVLVGVVQQAAADPAKPKSSIYSRLSANQSKLLWRAFNRFYVERACRASRLESISENTDGVPRHIDCPVAVGKFSQHLSNAGVDFIEQQQPDFILRFGFGILKGEVLTATPLGVWSYHHGDPTRFRGQPPGFWEIFSGSATTGVVLQVLGTELDAGRVLQSGHFRTISHSYAKTRDDLYFGASSWVAKACAEIATSKSLRRNDRSARAKGPIFKEPDNKEMLLFLWRTLANYCRMIATYKFSRQSWRVGIIDAPIDEVAGIDGYPGAIPWSDRVTWLPARAYQFNADPFGQVLDDPFVVRIFYECFDWRSRKGEIQSVRYDGSNWSERKTVLSSPTHLSYPFALTHEGKTYLIPENFEGREVSAYQIGKCGLVGTKTPIFERSDMIDATFLEWDQKFWVFALIDDAASNAELNIFHADSPWGPWQSHTRNPVKVDVRSARPAGTPFVHKGLLYRPAQDCGPNYGSAVVINRIDTLTHTQFEEREVARLEPPRNFADQHGLHTLSSVGAYTLIDASRTEWKFLPRSISRRR